MPTSAPLVTGDDDKLFGKVIRTPPARWRCAEMKQNGKPPVTGFVVEVVAMPIDGQYRVAQAILFWTKRNSAK